MEPNVRAKGLESLFKQIFNMTHSDCLMLITQCHTGKSFFPISTSMNKIRKLQPIPKNCSTLKTFSALMPDLNFVLNSNWGRRSRQKCFGEKNFRDNTKAEGKWYEIHLLIWLWWIVWYISVINCSISCRTSANDGCFILSPAHNDRN